ncbi:MAG TPA: alkaline phosphatase family protein [Myxococcota bacterium]
MQEQLEQAAGQLDDLVAAIAAHRADLYLYRYDPTDMLAHNYLPAWNGNGTIARRSPFFSAYDYLDRRLSDVVAAMDADDVLLLLSDHGTQNSANHDRRAVYVAAGVGVVPHRVDGISIEHVPSYLAALLCVQDPWKLPIVVGAIPDGCR